MFFIAEKEKERERGDHRQQSNNHTLSHATLEKKKKHGYAFKEMV